MHKQYSQWTAMWAICGAALRSIFRSPQAVFFSLFFPIVLIVVFGALSGGGGVSLDIAFDGGSDTTNAVYQMIAQTPGLNIIRSNDNDLIDRLKKGRITAIIDIRRKDGPTSPPGKETHMPPRYDVHLKTTSAGQKDFPILQMILSSRINGINSQARGNDDNYATISSEEIRVRPYRMIDFYLPGMLGFALIGSAVFGVSFLFFTLRETLVLKRMYSTPVKRAYIVLGEGLGRLVFQLATAAVLVLFGKIFYQFTLANGIVTFLEMMALSLLGLLVFMGFGFIISSIAKNQNVIPIYANLFMFPQYFLSGTFFPKSLMPHGIQWLINILPLTALNDALRKVSFEGAHLWNAGHELLVLSIWCVAVYVIAARVFRWE
ncbi:MAG: ABC transporter permease [Bacteroidota bacterium]|nr:ABC transporter permease [Bacteroidota bacterium]MDP4246804.1 ABC transporter permease [Bacteroidota bacterium]MDP4259530.1 ABC transporter permease [Bacteroidota bacterium]